MSAPEPPRSYRILVVDDDTTLRQRLVLAFCDRGHDAVGAASVREGLALARSHGTERAVVDLRMPEETGLEFVRGVRASNPDCRIIILTGYGSITSAIQMIREGVWDYLSKPADADQILASFERPSGSAGGEEIDSAPSLDRVEWEHIQRVLADCGGNVSKAARVLGVHRRSLQRKLARYAPRR